MGKTTAGLYLCATGSGPAAGTDGYFRERTLSYSAGPFLVRRCEARHSRHSRVGSSSGSGVSWGGRRSSSYLSKIDSDPCPGGGSPSDGIDRYIVRRKLARGLRVFYFPVFQTGECSFLAGEFATTIKGIFTRVALAARGGFFAVSAVFTPVALARDGATRAASPSILRKCGGQGASAIPARSSFSASSRSFSSESGAALIAA